MFRHEGRHRTYKHNIRLASLLSLIAGIVNITGVLSVATLTTNVTGHFAFFAEELFFKDYIPALNFLLFILCFLAGAFSSNLIVEILLRKNPKIAHAAPMFVEIVFLCTAGLWPFFADVESTAGLLAGILLFSMGLQNAMVTKLSQFMVRTTHLTGLFTDLGIELSQLFFYRELSAQHKLRKSILLRLTIICCFFAGCIGGGFIFAAIGLQTLLIAALVLLIALFYDRLLYYYYDLKRKAAHQR